VRIHADHINNHIDKRNLIASHSYLSSKRAQRAYEKRLYEKNQAEVSGITPLPVFAGAGIAGRPYRLLFGMCLAAAL
jgi:hypothetical protein